MRGWAGKALGGESRAGRADSGASEIEVVGRGLVEVEVGDGLGLGGVEGRCLIEEPGADEERRGPRMVSPLGAVGGCCRGVSEWVAPQAMSKGASFNRISRKAPG